MNFYFCEKCGKRVTEVDLESGAAKDKKLKGVYCTECAVGVMTMELQPLSDEDARRILSPHTPPSQASSHESSHGKLPKRPGPPSDAHLRAALRSGAPPAGTPDRANSVPRTVLWVAAPAALLLVLLGAGLLSARREDKKAEPTPAPAPKLPAPGLAQAKSRSWAPPAPPSEPPPPAWREPATPAPSETPAPPVAEGDLSPEGRAQNAFDDLIKFDGLAADDRKGRAERLQAFLEKHGETIVSARARVLLENLAAPLPVAPPPGPSSPVLPSSGPSGREPPVAHWRLDDGSGTTAADSSGSGIAGTLMNGPAWTAGKVGGALGFDGVNDYVDAGSGASLNLTGEVSVAAWVKPSGTGLDQKIAGNQSGAAGGYKLAVFRGSNKVEFEIRDSANAQYLNRNVPGGTVLVAGTWYHVVGVYSRKGGFIRTYVNGVLDRELLTDGVLTVTAGSFKLGREPYKASEFWNGLLDDVRVYNRAMSEAEVAALAGAGVSEVPEPVVPLPIPDRPVANWSLDEGKGTVALDSSEGKHHGTLVNAPVWVEGKIGRALQFNGKDNYLVADGLEVDTKAGGKNSVAFWMHWGGVKQQSPFGWGDMQYNLLFKGDGFGINTREANILGISSEGLANRWVHVVAVFPNAVPGPANTKLYINGVEQTLELRMGETKRRVTASARTFFGTVEKGSQFKFGGMLDELRIYRRELTALEVHALAGAGGSDAPRPDGQAEAAWSALQARGKDVGSQALAKELLGELAALEERYAGTAWVQDPSALAARAAFKERLQGLALGLDPRIRRLFKGQVTAYDPRTQVLSVTYDFLEKEQTEDFPDSPWNPGVASPLRWEKGSVRVHCTGKFNQNLLLPQFQGNDVSVAFTYKDLRFSGNSSLLAVTFFVPNGAGTSPPVAFLHEKGWGFSFKMYAPRPVHGSTFGTIYKTQTGNLPPAGGKLEVSCKGSRYEVKADGKTVLEYAAAETGDRQGVALGGGWTAQYTLTHLQVTGKLDPRWLAKALEK